MRALYPTCSLALAALTGLGCGADLDVISVSFADELVEAPARNVEIAVVSDAPCDDTLNVAHEDLETVGTVLRRTRTRYPVAPDVGALEQAPRGRALSIDVSVLDAQDRQIARACDTLTLPAGQVATLDLRMHALARCSEAPTSIDLALVVDTSLGMRDANVGLDNQIIDLLKTFVQNLGVPGGRVRFSVASHGDTAPQQVLAPTLDREAASSALESLRGVAGGQAQHYGGASFAGAMLRDSALCDFRPAIVWVGGGADMRAPEDFQLAALQLSGTRGESFDDVFVYGVGISADAVGAMALLVDDLDLARLEGALTTMRTQEILRNVHSELQALVP